MALGTGTAAADPGCPKLYVVAIPGTWETGEHRPEDMHGPGMLAGVTRGLPRSTEVDYVDYAATAFPWEGDVYGASKKQAIDNARGLIGAMAARCGATHIALVGYSQGADAAGDLAAEIGTGLGVVPPDRVAGVGLISDPRRSPLDVQVGPAVGGAGAGGPRPGGFGFLSDRVRTICAAGDLYCATDDQDYVTRFAGFLAQASGATAANLWRYQLEAGSIIGDLMAHGGIPTLQAQLTDDANQQRVKQLEQFYGSGTHTSYGNYYVGGGQTAISWMHNWIAGMA
ncbi:cutinase family protein [Nocardia sp. CDC159]|uniref:Cutinase family protein n=1 Tax=Nocardia pulmonis TaxID=2951408 RepID=A0A9X2EEU2_9NOCA|nr:MULTISPECIES: cutinase family protein [Nocardia]MCM6776923.1 cutinase family protein [Nocardia pulmonis]MCM6789347.1 cutinase family protein [Nocardia sp. CDC159]